MTQRETFSSAGAVIIAGLGMAVGTGNLWRFPRIAAQNGGAAFLVPWMIFLVLWSLPLLVGEFGLGRAARRSPIGTFATLVGRQFAWMGGFLVLTTVMIMFHYSVVTGWTLKYLSASLFDAIPSDSGSYWEAYSRSGWQPVAFHIVAVALGAAIVSRGVVNGIERANRILIPLLFVLLVGAVGRALTLDGAHLGLRFLFQPDFAALTNYRTWLEALTQSAWSTGAGWGLILTYAIYVRREENIIVNSTAIGIGNNVASLLAAMAILPTAFALLSPADALDAMAAGNKGLTFVWIPQLFERVPLGSAFLPIFFLALFCAALSSLIAMLELATRVLIDRGMSRPAAVRIVAGLTCLGGLPSAVSMSVFDNQDWVWGLALLISGLFVSIGAARYGVDRFRNELLTTRDNEHPSRVATCLAYLLVYLVPVQFVAVFGWWVYQAVAVYDPDAWWNPVRVYSLGSCLVQWGAALVFLVVFNERLVSDGPERWAAGRVHARR